MNHCGSGGVCSECTEDTHCDGEKYCAYKYLPAIQNECSGYCNSFCFLSAQSWASGKHTLPLHPGYTSVPRASLAPLRVTPFRPNSPRFRLFCLGRGRFCLRLGLRLFCWPSATRMHTRASRSAWGSSRLVVAHCSRHLTKSIMATYER